MNAPLTDDDAALLRRYRRGDAAAFNALYQRHRLGLFRFLLGLCGDHALAEEAFQETWMSLVRARANSARRCCSRPGSTRSRRNRLIDHWRKTGRHQAGHDEYDEGQHAQADPQPEALSSSGASVATVSGCRRHWPTCRKTSAKCSCCAPMATWN